MHHTRRSVGHHFQLPVGHAKRTYTIFTEHHSVIHGIRYIDFGIGTGHTVIFITYNQRIAMTVHSTYRNIFQQLGGKTQRNILEVYSLTDSTVNLDSAWGRQILTHLYFIRFAQIRRAGIFTHIHHYSNGIAIETLVHQEAIVQSGHITRRNTVYHHFRGIRRKYVVR